jgi:hypothetical protein
VCAPTGGDGQTSEVSRTVATRTGNEAPTDEGVTTSPTEVAAVAMNVSEHLEDTKNMVATEEDVPQLTEAIVRAEVPEV